MSSHLVGAFVSIPQNKHESIRIIVPDRTDTASSPVRGFTPSSPLMPIKIYPKFSENVDTPRFSMISPGKQHFHGQNSVVSQRKRCATKEQIMLKGLTPPDQSVDRIKENVVCRLPCWQRIIMGGTMVWNGTYPLVLWRFYHGFLMGKSWEYMGIPGLVNIQKAIRNRWFTHYIKMVDLFSSVCKRLPEGTSYNAMYTDAWIANL